MSKKVIIIGGSSGLGLDIAKIFGKNNNQIVLISSDESKLISVTKELNNQNISCSYFKCNLSIKNEVDATCDYLKSISSNIEVIVFSSAKGYFGEFKDLKISQIENIFSINSFGFIKILNETLKYNEGCRYIYISYYACKIPLYRMSIYSSSKIVLDKIFESLKLDYEKGKFLTVYPGPMNTDFDDNAIIENNVVIRRSKKKFNSNLISKKIYRSFILRKDVLEINSGQVKLALLFKIILTNLFYKFLRFFN